MYARALQKRPAPMKKRPPRKARPAHKKKQRTTPAPGPEKHVFFDNHAPSKNIRKRPGMCPGFFGVHAGILHGPSSADARMCPRKTLSNCGRRAGIGLRLLSAASVPDGKWSGDRRTTSTTLSNSPGVSLATTS